MVKAAECSICTLETDCGQPDNTPPGILSYSTRSLERETGKACVSIESQRFLGLVNPAVDPFQYIEVVEQVYADYTSQDSDKSLIVNCHGYGASVGLETWEAIITLIQPDVVVHIQSDGDPALKLREPIQFLSTQLPIPTPDWRTLSPIITIAGSSMDDPNQASSVDYRWIKFAQHFRPDLIVKNQYRASHPRDFFVFPYTRALILNHSKLKIIFTDSIPSDPLRAIDKLIVGLCDSSTGQFVCLAFVASYSGEEIRLIIPPNILESKMTRVDSIVRGSVNWSPRDKVSYRNKTTTFESSKNEPYFLTNVLGGVDTGARQA